MAATFEVDGDLSQDWAALDDADQAASAGRAAATAETLRQMAEESKDGFNLMFKRTLAVERGGKAVVMGNSTSNGQETGRVVLKAQRRAGSKASNKARAATATEIEAIEREAEVALGQSAWSTPLSVPGTRKRVAHRLAGQSPSTPLADGGAAASAGEPPLSVQSSTHTEAAVILVDEAGETSRVEAPAEDAEGDATSRGLEGKRRKVAAKDASAWQAPPARRAASLSEVLAGAASAAVEDEEEDESDMEAEDFSFELKPASFHPGSGDTPPRKQGAAAAAAAAESPASAADSPAMPLKELTAERIQKRQRQVDIGKNTQGYLNYRAAVPIEMRNRRDPDMPATPDRTRKCSKRQWEGQIRAWRRALHKYDDVDVQAKRVEVEAAFKARKRAKAARARKVGAQAKGKQAGRRGGKAKGKGVQGRRRTGTPINAGPALALAVGVLQQRAQHEAALARSASAPAQ